MKGKKTGGRKKGTPNKENPLKGFLKAHSLAYFEPKETKYGLKSDFEIDMELLDSNERVNAELRLLEFHTPKMKSVDMDMRGSLNVRTIEDRLLALSQGEDPDDENDEDE